MRTTDSIDAREALITKLAESKEDLAALRIHLKGIIEGPAFKGSYRCGQFLQHVVEQSIAGNFERLKERLIGIEVFGRAPSYDTGENAIVRVTASDVRKRLLQHYGTSGTSSEFRIHMPLGSYIPEISHDDRNSPSLQSVARLEHLREDTRQASERARHRSEATEEKPDALSVLTSALGISQTANTDWRRRLLLLALVNLGFWILYWNYSPRTRVPPTASILPWSVLFNTARSTHLITSDPNIVVIQQITGHELSLSDYANHRFIPNPNDLGPETARLSRAILWGDNSAAGVDPPISANISALAQLNSKKLEVSAARTIQLSDLRTDDNFIFLGSPRSDPWFLLFDNQLDFRFAYDKASGQEFILNAHPRQHELQAYVPTASGWATGQSFAIVALVQNLDQSGQVLLLAGADGEGTEAAGNLVTDLTRMSGAMQMCGASTSNLNQHFELLLRLNTMAGSPSRTDVLACHLLPGSATR